MPSYPKPHTSDDYRASAQECLDRAQRALEVAEINLDKAVEAINNQALVPTLTCSTLIAQAEARTRLGSAWADLAMCKTTAGEVAGD